MTYANLSTLLGYYNKNQIFGIQLTSGSEIQLAMTGRNDISQNKYHTRWVLNSKIEALEVIHQIITPAGPGPVIIEYYPAESIQSVQAFLTSVQITENETWDKTLSAGTDPSDTFTDIIV